MYLKSRTWPSNAPFFLSRSLSFLRMYEEMRRSEVSASPCPSSSFAVKTKRLFPPFSFFSFAVNSPREQKWRVDRREGTGEWRGWVCWWAQRVELEADWLQSLSLWVVEVAWEHAVTRLLGKLSQEVCEVGLQRECGEKKSSAYKIVVPKSGRQSRQRKGENSELTGVNKLVNLAESCWFVVIKYWHGDLQACFHTTDTLINFGTAAWDFVFMQSSFSASCTTITACKLFFFHR